MLPAHRISINSEIDKEAVLSQGLRSTPAIPALERLTQEDNEFKASLGYIGEFEAS
jgi:hypothetical protein